MKDEHASAGQNAIECLQQNMAHTGSLWQVIEENGSEFRNNYVHLDEMQGRVRVRANTDEGLPMTPEQKRQWCETIMEMAEKQNPAALAWLDETANQQLLNDYWGLPGSVAPGAAQRSKTLQDIRRLLQTPPTPKIGPNGMQMTDPDDGTPMFNPSIAPNKWVEDYNILLPTIDQFCAANCDVKQQNPLGWQNIIAFKRLALDYQSAVDGYMQHLKMTAAQAGQPPKAQPNPAVQAMEAKLLQQAGDAADMLHRAAQVPITTPKLSQPPVAAAKEMIDTVVKVMGQ
jgi:hypothetical protein